MNLVDIIVIIIVILIIVFASKSAFQHMKGKGSCCGGDSKIIEPDKTLTEPIIGKYVVEIEGMTCENCSNRIKRSLNSIPQVSATVSHRKKEAIVSYTKDVSKEEIKEAIERLDYRVISIR